MIIEIEISYMHHILIYHTLTLIKVIFSFGETLIIAVLVNNLNTVSIQISQSLSRNRRVRFTHQKQSNNLYRNSLLIILNHRLWCMECTIPGWLLPIVSNESGYMNKSSCPTIFME